MRSLGFIALILSAAWGASAQAQVVVVKHKHWHRHGFFHGRFAHPVGFGVGFPVGSGGAVSQAAWLDLLRLLGGRLNGGQFPPFDGGIQQRFASIDARLTSIDAKLNDLNAKVDRLSAQIEGEHKATRQLVEQHDAVLRKLWEERSVRNKP